MEWKEFETTFFGKIKINSKKKQYRAQKGRYCFLPYPDQERPRYW